MTDKMSANKRTDEDPPWANLLKNVLWTVATIYDIVSFVQIPKDSCRIVNYF